MMAKHGPEETPRPVVTATGTGTLDGTTSAPSSPPPVEAASWGDVSLGRRVLRPRTALSFLVAAALVALALSRFDIDPRAVAREIGHANLLFLGLAFAAYYGSFVIRAERWRSLLASADVAPDPGHRMPGIAGLVTIFLLSWFVNCLVPAKLGDAYRGYLLKQRARTSFGSALGTIFAERLADLVMLALLLVASGWLVFGRHMPALVTDWMYVAVAIGAALLVGLVAVYRLRYYLRGLVPLRVRDHYVRVEQGTLGSFGNVPFLVSLTAAIWMFEGARVYLIGLAVGAGLGLAAAMFVALLASLLTALPLTPAGLGVVELGMVGVITLLGKSQQTAASVALLDRIVAYWSVIPVGGLVYLLTRWRWRS